MKNAVILGATAGVGRAIAEQLHKEIYTTGFHRGLAILPNQIPLIDILHKQDAGKDYDSVNDALDILEDFLPNYSVQVLVHSLSGASLGNVLDSTPQQIERTFNCLAHSFLWWAQGLKERELLASDARLIALSNPCPDFYLRNTGVIGAAKAALEAYVKMLAVELGPSGVRVNCVRFGMVKTPAIEKVLNETALQHMQKVNERLMPAGRMQTVEDVAKTVKWLVSDDAYWLNGAIIDATGGCTSTMMDYAFYGPR